VYQDEGAALRRELARKERQRLLDMKKRKKQELDYFLKRQNEQVQAEVVRGAACDSCGPAVADQQVHHEVLFLGAVPFFCYCSEPPPPPPLTCTSEGAQGHRHSSLGRSLELADALPFTVVLCVRWRAGAPKAVQVPIQQTEIFQHFAAAPSPTKAKPKKGR